ncbi:MAG: ATPase, T2SS/T4P/T4SS family [Patescibacteria group bacterium]
MVDVPATAPIDINSPDTTGLDSAPAVTSTAPSLATNDGGKYNSVLDVLVAKQQLSKEEADTISFEQINTGRSVEEIVAEKKSVDEETLTRAKAEFYHVPFVKLQTTGVSPEALAKIPESVAKLYRMFPFSWDKNSNILQVAMFNPLDLSAVDFAEKKSNCKIEPFIAEPSELDRIIAEKYAQSLSSEVTAALKQTKQVSQQEVRDLSQLSGEVIRDAPITKIVETILSFAMKAKASDVHIEPQEDRLRVRYRIDGILYEKLVLPKSVQDAVVSRIKILSQLKIDEKRIPQDGRFTFFSNGEEVDLRISTLPTVHGEKVVMRLLKKNTEIPTLSDLGMQGMALKQLETAIHVPHGIILVTGPTGSGKTTTLYSVLHKINTPKVNIMTLEDPVEYQMEGVNQVQINPQAGLTFASGLRSFLRQDPNIIMVGEIRDNETADLAIQASLTGHLVFSTLHTNSAAGALPRLLDMKAEPFLLASSITLVMAQRVVRKINEKYKEEYHPPKEVIDNIAEVLGPVFTAWCKQQNKEPSQITLFRPAPNRPAQESEYTGRIGIFEVMPMTDKLSRLILDHSSAGDLEKVAVADGMLLMKQDGYVKVLQGITTLEEVLRVAET